MAVADVTDTLEDALKATGLSEARVRHRPRLLSDNGPCYISSDTTSHWTTSHQPTCLKAGVTRYWINAPW